jgi:hypothetical protein
MLPQYGREIHEEAENSFAAKEQLPDPSGGRMKDGFLNFFSLLNTFLRLHPEYNFGARLGGRRRPLAP